MLTPNLKGLSHKDIDSHVYAYKHMHARIHITTATTRLPPPAKKTSTTLRREKPSLLGCIVGFCWEMALMDYLSFYFLSWKKLCDFF